ncbi:hypothetical protein TrVGV298_003920 [Trichoderma virens]|nr:hypothetical protein TrVGV298_003920 [Trichoderma virens]
MSGLLIGLNLSSMSGFLDVMAYSPTFAILLRWEREIVTAAMPIASILGALVSWRLMDDLKPPRTMLCASVFWLIGSCLMAVAPGLAVLSIGRVLAGLAAGILSVAAPAYMVEIAPRENRGAYMSLLYLFIAAGIFLQNVNQYVAAKLSWSMLDMTEPIPREDLMSALRVSFIFQLIPGSIFTGFTFLLPQSPYYLASQGHWAQSHAFMAELQKKRMNDPRLRAQYELMREDIRDQRQKGQPRLRMLLRVSEFRRLVTGLFMQMWNQACGMHIMLHHTVFVVTAAGVRHPNLVIFVLYLLNVVATCVLGSRLMDKWGRRVTLLIGSLTMASCLSIIGIIHSEYAELSLEFIGSSIYGWFPWVIENRGASTAVVVFACFYIIAYAASWGPVSWTYTAEIFPNHLRTRGIALCSICYWIYNVALTFTELSLLLSYE